VEPNLPIACAGRKLGIVVVYVGSFWIAASTIVRRSVIQARVDPANEFQRFGVTVVLAAALRTAKARLQQLF
jgi:hypothetical protein